MEEESERGNDVVWAEDVGPLLPWARFLWLSFFLLTTTDADALNEPKQSAASSSQPPSLCLRILRNYSRKSHKKPQILPAVPTFFIFRLRIPVTTNMTSELHRLATLFAGFYLLVTFPLTQAALYVSPLVLSRNVVLTHVLRLSTLCSTRAAEADNPAL